MQTEDQQNSPRWPGEPDSHSIQVGLSAGMGAKGRANLEELHLYYARLLNRWSLAGGRSLRLELLQAPGAGNAETAIVRAEATGGFSRAVGYGSADPRLLGSADPGKLLECAELVAKIDALAAALKAMQPAPEAQTGGRVISRGLSGGGTQLPFMIPSELVARQKIDLGPPQGENAKMYRYFHQLIQQMGQRSRQLQQEDLGLLDQVAQHKHDLSFYTYAQALVMVSHSIEDEFVQRQLSQPFYAGFQYFSRLRPQEPRYRAILRSAQRLVVFGLADVALWYELRLESVPIDVQRGTGLERFWFVATKGPTWSSALLAEHLDGDFTTPLIRRKYQGFWTFDPAIVERIVGTLDYAQALLTGPR